MHRSILGTSSAALCQSVLSALIAAFSLGCSGSSSSGGDSGNTTASGGQATTGAGGASTGGASSAGTSSTTGGSATAGNTSTAGSSAGGATGSGGTGTAGTGTAGTGSGTPVGYTITGYNNASWAGAGDTDTIEVNANGYLPMTTSDCAIDPDMASVAPYKDKIFNGCLDECFGDPNMAGHGLATVMDWNVSEGGWAVAQVSSTLHWTGMWPPSTGSNPTVLVFWVKGAAGGEQDKFTVAIHAHLGDSSKALAVPIAITQEWQRVVMPWADFEVPGDPYPDAVVFGSTTSGHVTFFIDQAYLSNTVTE